MAVDRRERTYRNNPRERSTTKGERELIYLGYAWISLTRPSRPGRTYPSHDNKAPTSCSIVRAARWKLGRENCGDQENNSVCNVGTNESPASSSIVDEQHAADLAKDCDHRCNSLVFESLIACYADLFENGNGIVLDSGYAGHLDRSLDRAS